jgi:hypothetical protein
MLEAMEHRRWQILSRATARHRDGLVQNVDDRLHVRGVPTATTKVPPKYHQNDRGLRAILGTHVQVIYLLGIYGGHAHRAFVPGEGASVKKSSQ